MASLYQCVRPVLFQFPPEKAHMLAIKAIASGILPQAAAPAASLRTSVAGLDLPSPVGLAAGFDKNAQTLPHIFRAGFGFAECGTVTPRPQSGNPQPRLFRLIEHEAVINRLGFNNDGLEAYVRRLSAYRGGGVVGANIGKNKDSVDAVADYVTCMREAYPHASYVTVNISSPNTAGLRDLQAIEPLRVLHDAVRTVRQEWIVRGQPYKPVFVKLAPDLTDDQLDAIAQWALADGCDGLILGNTTIDHRAVAGHCYADEQGGLSGKPLFDKSTQRLAAMYEATRGHIVLIGAGGIASAEDAYEKIKAGASAVQLYTALVYQGLGVVARINTGLAALLSRDGYSSLAQAVGASAKV